MLDRASALLADIAAESGGAAASAKYYVAGASGIEDEAPNLDSQLEQVDQLVQEVAVEMGEDARVARSDQDAGESGSEGLYIEDESPASSDVTPDIEADENTSSPEANEPIAEREIDSESAEAEQAPVVDSAAQSEAPDQPAEVDQAPSDRDSAIEESELPRLGLVHRAVYSAEYGMITACDRFLGIFDVLDKPLALCGPLVRTIVGIMALFMLAATIALYLLT